MPAASLIADRRPRTAPVGAQRQPGRGVSVYMRRRRRFRSFSRTAEELLIIPVVASVTVDGPARDGLINAADYVGGRLLNGYV